MHRCIFTCLYASSILLDEFDEIFICYFVCMVYSLVMPAAISFTGYRHRKKLVRNAVEWFLPKYVGKHILNIEIYDKQMNREGTNGACSFLGSFKKPRRFFIEMNNSLDDNEYLQSLFHELIHMKQWIFRQRITTKNHNDYWYGKLIGDEIDYMELPWEKEAYQLENSVFLWYLRSQGNTIEDKFKK